MGRRALVAGLVVAVLVLGGVAFAAVRGSDGPGRAARRPNVLLLVTDDAGVFYLSDNGYSWGEHRHVGKFVPYTESIRVPFLVRWPGRLPAGTVDDRLVATVDIAPTVLQAAGIAPDPGDPLDGRSLLDGRRRGRLLAEYWRDQANDPGNDPPATLAAELAAARACVGASCP